MDITQSELHVHCISLARPGLSANMPRNTCNLIGDITYQHQSFVEKGVKHSSQSEMFQFTKCPILQMIRRDPSKVQCSHFSGEGMPIQTEASRSQHACSKTRGVLSLTFHCTCIACSTWESPSCYSRLDHVHSKPIHHARLAVLETTCALLPSVSRTFPAVAVITRRLK